ncbi:RNA polymerase sigma factor [Amycolatopsis eburnea]|uniref:Sigma-70 family RNA polymerase sigma factor n=1 Tax=Amycolatopsis eburnea TaxID=2267691 RepID=A0A3R9EQL0_9PSEU|nr:sigma-70 family RNA polymerase sigma factor [Amycolatopsis eburnea]RSD17151.1 sigma-70 family RNA polymerase sigma factor [Amycolatopsis eburnea]
MDESTDDDHLPDRRLLAELRAGNPAAGDRLFRRHAGPLRRVAARWARQPAERDDLVAEAFACVLAVVRAGGGPKDDLRPYLVVTMRNLAARWNRYRERVEPHAVVPGAAVAEGTEELVLRRSTDELVRSAFHTLPVRWRTVLWNIVAEGRTPADLAPVMGISANGVAALAGRARAGLRLAYLQAQQLPAPRTQACRDALRQLEIWLRGGRYDACASTVAAHLAECTSCRQAVPGAAREGLFALKVFIGATARRAGHRTPTTPAP